MTLAVRRARTLAGEPLAFLAAVCLGSRAYFFAAGAVGHAFVVQVPPGGSPVQPPGFLSYWAHWDGAWYAAIATHGYYDSAAPAFFPLYPLVVAAFDLLPGGPALWGVAVSTASFCAATFFLYEIAEKLFDAAAARATAVVFSLFPTAFFLNAVYTEALFVALAAGAVWALYVRRQLFLTFVLAYFAMATRSIGVMLLVPLAYEALVRQRQRPATAVPSLLASTGGLAAYAVYLWRRYGSPLYFEHAERKIWGRQAAAPWHTLDRAWHEAVQGAGWAFRPVRVFSTADAVSGFRVAGVVDLAALVLALALLVVAWRLLPLGLWLYSLLVLAPPVIAPSPVMALMSMPRYVIAAFPLFVVLGRVLARSPRGLAAWTAGSAALGLYFTLLFTSWRWIA